jgi:hypothetical protein
MDYRTSNAPTALERAEAKIRELETRLLQSALPPEVRLDEKLEALRSEVRIAQAGASRTRRLLLLLGVLGGLIIVYMVISLDHHSRQLKKERLGVANEAMDLARLLHEKKCLDEAFQQLQQSGTRSIENAKP